MEALVQKSDWRIPGSVAHCQMKAPSTPDSTNKVTQAWGFTLELMAAYILVFEAWLLLTRTWIIASAVVVVALCSARMFTLMKAGKLPGIWSRLIHASVILDILLEGLLIPEHTNRGFYICAAAFLLVIWAYQRTLQDRAAGGPTSQILGVDPGNPA